MPGLSVSWGGAGCRTFTYAAGLRNVERAKPLTPATRMGIASMTKPVIAAVTLKLNETGLFGPDGLDTPVDRLLTPRQISELTVGDDPTRPRCPGSALLLNRLTLEYEPQTFSCPDLSQVTLRQLMTANHGMYDYLNEVLLPSGFTQYGESLLFELLQSLGESPTPPVSSTNGFEYLKAFGLKRNDTAVIGGNLDIRDFEISFGNTGFQLLGVILEQRTGRSLNELIRDLIVEPLDIDPISLYLERRNQIADGYDVFTGEPLIETTGVYPLVDFNGHTAVNTLSFHLGLPANLTTAGGAGGLIANPKSYRNFLHAFVNGNLLGPDAKAELESSFVLLPTFSTPEVKFFNGLGIFKDSYRGFPGIPDVDLMHHGGELPGVLCHNSAVRRVDHAVPSAAGVLCINARQNAYPDPFELGFEFIRRFLAVPTGASTGASRP